MTIQAVDPALLPSGKICKGKRHTASNQSWRDGCRHEGAVAAHERWKAEKRPDTRRPPALDADGRCVADKHNSRKAFITAGCRCPESVRLQELYARRRANYDRARKDVEAARLWDARAQRARRLTGGRLPADPRRHWRGGRMAVDRNNLFLLIRGMVDRPTMGEKLAASILLSETLVPDDRWYRKPHLMNCAEIGRRLGLAEVTVAKLLRKDRQALRDSRSARRLADAQWRAAVAAEAPARLARELRVRAAAEARKAEWKQHCRTMRRLRQSQERAKRITLAIERRG